MPRTFVRSSKFRHVYGAIVKKEFWYDGIHVTTNSHDSSFSCVNSKFIAVVLESGGGGCFLVLPIGQTGRVDTNCPKVSGHKSKVSDIKWNPFNDNIIASGSEDCIVKLWHIPDRGLLTDLKESVIDLVGHQRRVSSIQWHPTASNILASVGFDHCLIIWDVSKGERAYSLTCHPEAITSISWNKVGSHLVTTCRDKKIRIIEPRKQEVTVEEVCHQGNKSCHACFLTKDRLLTTGFSQSNEREMAIWDTNDMTFPLLVEDIDAGTSPLYIFYDCDTSIVYLAGRGDGNIRYYEVSLDPLGVYFLNEFRSTIPQRGLTALPKRSLRVENCEIFRFYKLHTNALEPISMIVPRKETGHFQSDLYPLTQGDTPSLEAAQWLKGENAEPVLISLEDGYRPTTKEFTTPGKRSDRALWRLNSKLSPQKEKELQKLFHLQQEEIKTLKREMEEKDKKILYLQKELARLVSK